MMKNLIAITCFVVVLVSCNKVEHKLEGKWQLKTVEANGVVQTVDTVWYNFQTSLFEYQFYDPRLANDSLMGYTSYPVNYGYKTLAGEKSLELELVNYGRIPLSRFLLYTDWSSSKRVFTIEKSSTTELVLNGDGKTYTFKKF
ncbi:lipocalin-like domain-containing protein [Parabacteroides sp.]